MVNIKELLFGNYKNENDYVPDLIARIKNRKLSKRENGKVCSCGIRSYCMFHYCFPSKYEMEKISLKSRETKE